MAGEYTSNIIDAVDAYANKRVEDALEVAAETTQELTKAIVESYDRAIDEANGYAAELGNLVDDNRELLHEITELRSALDMAVEDRTQLRNIIDDMKEALAEYRVKEAMGEYYKYLERDEPQEVEEKVQPDCCAAGHCGTDECGEHCKDDEGFDSLEDLFRAMFK